MSIDQNIPRQQLQRMQETTLDVGIVQHSTYDKPNLAHPSSIDDNARALIVASRFFPGFDPKGAHQVYLEFIEGARREDGLFNNYRDFDGELIRDSEPSRDCYGRAMWSLAEFAHSAFPSDEREGARDLFFDHLPTSDEMEHPMGLALTLIGFSKFLEGERDEKVVSSARSVADRLKDHHERESDGSWQWFWPKMTYCNARLPHSMALAGKVLDRKDLASIGRESFDFLCGVSFSEGYFQAVGNDGWYEKGKKVARFDQQTIEAGAMVEAAHCFHELTGERKYLRAGQMALRWFYGDNAIGEKMLDENSGGVYDAITRDGINENQGAESLLSYLMARSVVNA